MRKLLITTAIAFPLAAVPAAFAQETAPEAETEEAVPAEGAETMEEGAEDAGETMEEGAEDAAQAVEEGAEDAAQAVEEGAEETGEAVEEGAEETGAAVEEGAEDTGEALDEGVEIEEAAEDAGDDAGSGETIVREQAANELRLDWITGTTVQSPDGDNIGSINDLILDNETGQIKAAIVGVGGFLGIGEKQIAVAWDQLEVNYDANEITSNITQEEADEAPEYVFRDQEQAPAPAPAEGMGGGTMGDPAADPAAPAAPAD